ncbi:type II toxin-antitoxin system VapB family antitoxin [Pedobacter glucosidilyticus]|uniref:type II toxin-antitoxin system VapB family antitoxin n=1 Tax=Pedobacter glucosidilyticus TaxID=1122941 RepID=UPI0026EC9E36|nr:DUF2281 domain-containing protein [Pedobacter glucosidilyticus]
MSTTEILEKIRLIPENYQQEVVDFILEKKVKKTVISSKQRPLGLLKGKMKMSDSFDDPLEDFKNYM